jgi:hypothetical protein
MEKHYLKQGGSYNGFRLGFGYTRMQFDPAAGGQGGGNGLTPEQEQTALLEKIQLRVKTEIETRGYQDAASVTALMNTAMTGLPLEALRAYEADKTKTETTLRNIAGELEKVKNIRSGEIDSADKNIVQSAINAMLFPADGKTSEVELMQRSKGQGGTREVVLNIRAAANLTTTNTIDENNFPLEMIESMNVIDGVIKKRRGTQYVFDFADVTTVAELEEYTTWLEEGNEQGAFAIVAEGTVKPLVSYALVRNFAKAKKVAAKYVFTEEFTKWRKKAFNIIQGLIKDKILRDYAAILTTDLQTLAASYVGTSLDGTFVAPNDYDAIGAVAAQIETLNFFPDLLIIHPQDKWRLSLEKDSQGRYYMMIPMYTPDGMVAMMGFRVLTSTYQTIGSFTLGESGLFKIEQESLTIRLGYGIDVTTAVVSATTVVTAVSSDFDNNRMRIIVENYFKDYIATNHVGSFVTTTFAIVKQALQA